MAEHSKNTRIYPVHSQSPILETTPLYTTILTEVLDRIMAENRSMKSENLGLRKMIAKLQAGEDILGSGDYGSIKSPTDMWP